MCPDYKPGAVLEFRLLQPREPLKHGKDYYVELADGTTLFRRLGGTDRARIALVALTHPGRPHGFFCVRRSQVARMAIVTAVIVPIKYKSGRTAKPHPFTPGSNEGMQAQTLSAA
jgi:hypothetical protein